MALWLFLMAATDVVITGALVIYLNRAKTAFERTNSVIDRLLKVSYRFADETSQSGLTGPLPARSTSSPTML